MLTWCSSPQLPSHRGRARRCARSSACRTGRRGSERWARGSAFSSSRTPSDGFAPNTANTARGRPTACQDLYCALYTNEKRNDAFTCREFWFSILVLTSGCNVKSGAKYSKYSADEANQTNRTFQVFLFTFLLVSPAVLCSVTCSDSKSNY